MKIVTLLLATVVVYIGIHLVLGLKNIELRARVMTSEKIAGVRP